MHFNVTPIKAFQDNYIWAITPNSRLKNERAPCIVVDPGDAHAVLSHCQVYNLELTHILVTHHHPDHVGGIQQLKTHYPKCEIIGNEHSRYEGCTRFVNEGSHFNLYDIELSVLYVPGHTLDHLAYIIQGHDNGAPTHLFCGDTLFSGGCGRLFEGTPLQMHESLQRLAALPPDTLVYCAHEYTLANLTFAKAVEPNNENLSRYRETCERLRSENCATLPTSIRTELKINPFLRVLEPEVVAYLKTAHGFEASGEADAFGALRAAKDTF